MMMQAMNVFLIVCAIALTIYARGAYRRRPYLAAAAAAFAVLNFLAAVFVPPSILDLFH